MIRTVSRYGILLAIACAAATFALAPATSFAQQTSAKKAAKKAAKKTSSVKAGKGQKVCRVKLKYTGEVRTWTCPKEVPCCVWHEINYVKCGSTITGCL